MNDFLFSAKGKLWLIEAYIRRGQSTHVIAQTRGVYPNLVRRALTHHGIPIRDRSQAQRQALQSGRHRHPTQGRSHSAETRQKIGEAVSRSWLVLDARRRRQVELARQRWQTMSEEHRENLRRVAALAVRRTATEGSRLERFLAEGLRLAGQHVMVRQQIGKRHVDLYLPARGVAIQVDGPAHFLPIWGSERLARVVEADDQHLAFLLREGLAVVRVKNLASNLSQTKMRKLLTDLTSVLQSNKLGPNRVAEMEVN